MITHRERPSKISPIVLAIVGLLCSAACQITQFRDIQDANNSMSTEWIVFLASAVAPIFGLATWALMRLVLPDIGTAVPQAAQKSESAAKDRKNRSKKRKRRENALDARQEKRHKVLPLNEGQGYLPDRLVPRSTSTLFPESHRSAGIILHFASMTAGISEASGDGTHRNGFDFPGFGNSASAGRLNVQLPVVELYPLRRAHGVADLHQIRSHNTVKRSRNRLLRP